MKFGKIVLLVTLSVQVEANERKTGDREGIERVVEE